jgi:LCP family protein required for cell wall assembly
MPKSNLPAQSRFSLRLYLTVLAVGIVVGGIWWYWSHLSVGRVMTGITQDPLTVLQSDGNGRTNVVFLGVGGKGHEGGDLTDSIILFSYDHSNHRVTMIPIPRDIWIPSMAAKINTAYHYGNERGPGCGLTLMKSAVTEVTGVPVQYAVVLDFQGFEKIIDAVGGVDVAVENTFDDYSYPIAGKENAVPESARYEHIHFDAGLMHMDGVTALKFARSRHAEGDEGTDFARSKRQEKVILAFKDKLLSSHTLLSLSTLQNIFNSVRDSLDTDIGEVETGAFIHLFINLEQARATPIPVSLTDLYVNPKNSAPYQGQWVLIPKTNIEDIHAYVAKELIGQ